MVIPLVAAERQNLETLMLAENQLVELAREGNERAIRMIIQRYNRRLFRTARAIIRDDAEAEDIVQAAYVQAFTHLALFRGKARLSTWLTRIVLNEALGRIRRQRKTTGLEDLDMQLKNHGGQVLQFPMSLAVSDPEMELSRSEVRTLLEHAVDGLPVDFRAVFVLRDVEGMSTEETSAHLDIRIETVKTRLHRARKLMRVAIEKQLAGAFSALFPFDGSRCSSMADRVIVALQSRTKA
ncbi:RNA polymerase sigma factor [Rhizobium sullae]|uniref:RNA polymerase sigma factor n=1 Tax=Rhizobium sullae TaxID=50338 RepID=A0A4R3PWF0_RHISU|nr:RNA polymerase sigma factor [Rhizobium sullae]TCU11753.1 RNA polymerase sigma-70 factor (ECF subfamily) [Rhizobium sullae]